jgi:hypothetical protein
MLPRAIVITPASAAVPLGLYVHHLSRAGQSASVREIDLVALPVRTNAVQGAALPPRPQSRPLPAAGFALVQRRFAPTYTLIRFRSAAPVIVRLSTLYVGGLDARPVAILYQP